MRKISFQIMIFAIFYALLAFLSSCLADPVSIEEFLEADEVVEIIERNQERVFIAEGSDPGLIPGNGRITGLNPNLYYIIEERDESGAFLNVRFVTGLGARTAAPAELGKAAAGIITGLTNFRTYKVKSAVSMTGNFNHSDLATPPASPLGGTPTPLANGIISLPAPSNTYYLELPSTPPAINTENTSIRMFPIVPAGANQSPSFALGTNNIISLPGENTQTDYIFARHDTNGVYNVDDFRVLRVNIREKPSITITVTIDPHVDIGAALTFNPGSLTVSQADLLEWHDDDIPYEITVLSPPGTIDWYYNEYYYPGVNTFRFNDPAHGLDCLIIGSHTVSVIVTVGGIPYSRNLIINVVP